MDATEQNGQSTYAISKALTVLKNKHKDIATVAGWARNMGYEDPTTFSNQFRREFAKRPQPVLLAFRAKKAIVLLRKENLTNYQAARKLDLRNEKGLYQFVKQQLGYAPSTISKMPDKKYQDLKKKLDKKMKE